MQVIRTRLISLEENKGCENAPLEVLKELKNVRSNESGKIIEFSGLNLEEIHVDLNYLDEANHLIFENSKEIFEKNSRAFFIGGDHSISYSVIRAFNKIQENPLVIVFDAHSNCKNFEKLNSKNWLRKLIEEGFDSKKIILISSRNLDEEEIDFLKQNQILLIKIEVLTENLEGVCDLIMERARNSGGFYVSIDINCIDPAFAPGANFLETGGLSSRDLIYFIGRLAILGNFRGADIVEINPEKDINRMTVKLGAKLLGEMM